VVSRSGVAYEDLLFVALAREHEVAGEPTRVVGNVLASGCKFQRIEFNPALYRRTARDYDRFRVPYPRAMIDDLLDATGPSGRGRLLDLACGTGQITFALAERFAEVWAVDQEPDMIEVVRANARAIPATRVHALAAGAEELVAPAGAFELVAIGNAFHRLHREAVAERALGWLKPNHSIALLWSTGPWTGEASWQMAMAAVLEHWKLKLGARERVPAEWDQLRRRRPDADVLVSVGFREVRTARFPELHDWTVEELIGLMYSTSFLPRSVVGDHAAAFERDLHRELGDHADGGTLRETIDFAYQVARRPV
jgi:SAM-dependent methyltransferase